MKKLSIFLILILSFLVSCGQKEETKDEKVTIKIAGWNLGAKALKDVAKIYEEENPNIKVEILEVDSVYQKITPALVSGQGAPDSFTVQIRDLSAMLDKFPGQITDITEFVKKDKLEDKYVKSDMNLVTKDNKIYALPWGTGPVAVYYRKDLYEKAGIDPNSIETWDDFIEAGKKMKNALPDVAMTGYQAQSLNMFEMLFRQLGGTYIKDGKLNINSPEAVKAYELMVRMQKEGNMININDWNGRIVAFNNDKLASIIFPIWYAGTIKTTAENQSGKWGLYELPAFEKGGNRRSNLGGSVFVISNQSKYPKETYDFIKFATSEMGGLKVMTKYGLFSTYTPYYKTDEFKKQDEYFEIDLNSYFANLTEGIKPIEYGKVMLEASPILNNLTSSIMSGEDINKALEDASNSISSKVKIEVYK